jgi:group II intron reverse transcriptase/maturase
MRSSNTILGLIHERGRKGLPLERVYRLLYQPDLYLKAYGKIYRNHGAMTTGATSETVDAMSLAKIETIITALREGTFHWHPVRRVYIPKRKGGKMRPLGLPDWSAKLVQEVIRMILEAYYEPRFSDHSHGFRPERGCHTALREIQTQWTGTVWFLEGDISRCFDALDHHLLVSILRESIHDERFLALISRLLKAGYVEEWTFHRTLSGSPQGGIVSPVLANIYLDKLDKYMEQTLIPQHTRGKQRQDNKEYTHLANLSRYYRKTGEMDKANQYKREAQHLPSLDTSDPNYRRCKYVRYADDWLIGFIGPKAEVEAIKHQLEEYLRDHLKLELSDTKTLITHARSECARFLGYDVQALHNNTKRTHAKRCINGRIGLRVPHSVVQEKRQRYQRQGISRHRQELTVESDFTIIAHYQSEYRGLVDYYRLAYNLRSLNTLKWVMEQSLVKTLAAKFRLTVPQVYQRYKATITAQGRVYQGLQVVRPREGKKPLIAQWGGVSLQWDGKAILNDQPPRIYGGRTELEKRLLANTCEHCGTTDHIEVHHIRALKDLTKYTGRDKPEWVKTMAARHRKTLVLCRTCHLDIHAGRPLTRHTSSS